MQLGIKIKKKSQNVLNFMRIYIKKIQKKLRNQGFIKQCKWEVKYKKQILIIFLFKR